MKRRLWGHAILTVLGVGTLNAAAPAGATGPLTSSGAAQAASYVIGPNDVVEVSVLGRPDFTTRDRVSATGAIQLPFIGMADVGGGTIEQVEAML